MEELKAKLGKYFKKAEPAFTEITVIGDGGDKIKDTSLAYFNDAKHFLKQGEYVNAFAALEYAEGWLDAGVMLGVVKTKNKTQIE